MNDPKVDFAADAAAHDFARVVNEAFHRGSGTEGCLSLLRDNPSLATEETCRALQEDAVLILNPPFDDTPEAADWADTLVVAQSVLLECIGKDEPARKKALDGLVAGYRGEGTRKKEKQPAEPDCVLNNLEQIVEYAKVYEAFARVLNPGPSLLAAQTPSDVRSWAVRAVKRAAAAEGGGGGGDDMTELSEWELARLPAKLRTALQTGSAEEWLEAMGQTDPHEAEHAISVLNEMRAEVRFNQDHSGGSISDEAPCSFNFIYQVI
ncbi:hypothetical protein IF1G_06016 [Cordyceps javanica]|uniref:Uncharacterized protein n=1 Tax=Cordyceps javanica TaxID=43265 RepID=A0A545V023_9HYPO|nr:hypothetical protein IF1G_06016 [Cordyceps javanica]TQW05763.1 hypothetical protein IF2G_06885 [Cordyceps javanica]